MDIRSHKSKKASIPCWRGLASSHIHACCIFWEFWSLIKWSVAFQWILLVRYLEKSTASALCVEPLLLFCVWWALRIDIWIVDLELRRLPMDMFTFCHILLPCGRESLSVHGQGNQSLALPFRTLIVYVTNICIAVGVLHL
jgi:hypothetical protein